MRVLLANLKVFYQWRSVWAAGGLFVFLFGFNWSFFRFPPEAHQAGHNILFFELIFAVLGLGAAVGVLQLMIASHPLSFCLPGHRTAVRRLVFGMGIAVSLASSCAFVFLIARASIPPGRPALSLCCVFCASLALFLMPAACPFSRAGWLIGLLLAFPVFMTLAFAGPTVGLLPSLPVAIEHVVVHCSGPVAVFGILVAAGAWVLLGREPWFLRTGGDRRQGLFRRGVRSTVIDQVWRLASGEGAMGRVILRAMSRCEYASAPRYLWGTLYAWLIPGGGGRIQLILTVATALACGAIAWYLPSVGSLFIMMMVSYDTPSEISLYSNLPIAGGRRERFLATLLLQMIVGVVWTTSIALSFAAIDLVQLYLPPGGVRPSDLEGGVVRVDVRLAVLLTAFYPLLSFMELALDRSVKSFAMRVFILAFLYLPIMFAQPWLIGVPPAYVFLALSGSWLVCAYGLYRITMRRDLVSGRPEKAERSSLGTTRRIAELRRGQRRK